MSSNLPSLFLLLVFASPSAGQVLTPPIFNLARSRHIEATSTCGRDVSDPELFCQLTGGNVDKELKVQLIQGQVCDVCDPMDPERSHPAEYAIDGTERWWQSPPLSRGSQFNEVNLTIDMGQEFHVAYVFIRMANSPRPGVWVLERSRDHGVTFEPWAYFADTPSDCESYFGPESLQPITEDDSVRCYTQYSKVVPLEGGEIPFSLLNGRPSASTYINSTVLQQWTRATSIRLRLLRAKTLLGHLMSVAQQVPTVTRRYYYSVKDISIGGRCVCNGHADLCDPSPDDEYKLLCRCQHHTCGPQCEQCCPPYVQKSWQPANYGENFTCEPCNCHGHSDECVYDPSVDEKGMSMDIHGQMRGGGVCQNCAHFTRGINCDQCQDGYYRPYDAALNDTDVCQQCSCDVWYSTGNCVDGSGQCECRVEYQPPDCTQCSDGYYGYPDCQPCDCHLDGTRGRVCEVGGGQCPCKPNFTGKNCDQCSPGYFNFPECQPCECNSLGSVGAVCDLTSGQCDCLNNYGERRCHVCQDGYFNYPDCQYCNCDSTGTEVTICDKQLGLCLCREGYGGERCDRCSPGFYGYPNCQPCGCNVDGSTSTSCSVSGKCQCLPNFAGQTCHQCSPGFFNFPECLPCNCQPSGSIGVTCSGDGVCQCRPNFDGQKCGQCKENFYNFPLCEGCNCDPRGVTSSFAGCGSLEHLGELCECKPHVTGRICDTCRPLYWNLMLTNPDGCQECECNLAGTVGGVSVCDVTSSQCTCKPHVTSLQCGECRQGSYRLQAENVLGCQMCDCDVGGSLNEFCDQYTGQCSCRPRINGSNCSQPLQLHYFPTLFQHQYEAEDGRTPAGSAVRFGYDQSRFPNHSWRGYAVFSPLQREIIHDIWVEKPSLYRLVMRYVNPTLEPIIASVKMVPESPQDIIQNVKVRFEPTRVPALVTASGDTGDLPSPLVLNPGRWTVTTQNQIEGLLLDYLVILPSAYYEASILQERAREPCRLPHVNQQHDRHRQHLCVQYAYPDLEWAARALPTSARTNFGPAATTDQFSSSLDSIESLVPLDSAAQSELEFGVPVDASGRYVLLVDYLTPPDSPRSSDPLSVRVNSVLGSEIGSLVVSRCDLTTLCRQVVIDDQGRVGHFGLHPSNASVTLAAPSDSEDGDSPVLVHSVVAVPSRQWHMDYILPKPFCIKQNRTDCIHVDYPFPPQSTKVEFESGLTASGSAADTETQSSPATPAAASPAAAAVLVPLNANSSTVDVRGQVSQPGPHVLVVHYRQPDHPEFEVPVLLQNGRFYEGTLRVSHCPFVDGCRAVLEHGDRNKVFDILENYMLTVQSGGDDREVLLDYVYAVPAEVYSWQLLEPLHTDRSAQFLEQCAQNNFMVDTDQTGFCRESVFSLTADYNNGALECDCDGEGSLSFECDQFGGQCPCRPGVIGRRCNICATGYFGFPECKPCDCPSTALCDDLSGECICPPRVSGERCDRCVALTYGFDPLIGCEECSCNVQGVVDDNLQCNLLTGQCPCKDNIVSRSCDRCRPGHWAFPYCQQCNCDVRGTTEEICSQETSECFCKDHAVGQQCDQCLPGTFNLAQTNPDGCTRCFCFGKTDSCTSGFLYWTKTHRLQDLQWSVVSVQQSSAGVTVGNSTVDAEMIGDDAVSLIGVQSNVTHYLRLSPARSNLLATYGGLFNYTIVLQADDNGVDVSGADVILVGSNMTLLHYAYVDPQALENTVSVRIEPRFFRVPSGTESSREQLMQLLSSVDAVYLKALYWDTHRSAQLLDIAWSEAVPEGDPMYDPIASTIEECSCPDSYTGLSCEDCAGGHYRAQTGPFGGYCVPCNCNSHSAQCDPITGICLDCQHNTTGDHCERCVTGYHGDATRGTVDDCRICACPIPTEANNFAESCELSADGRSIRCECRPGYTGLRCESCAAGFHGQPEVPGDSCRPCNCSGNIDPSDPGSCDSVTGECLRCLNNTGGPACNLCARHFYGDAVALKDCQPCTCDKCGTSECVSYTGSCTCNENVEGLKCDRCAPNCWDFNSCQGCRECDCGEASESTSCDLESGQCRCRPGAAGRRCDLCAPGFWNYSPAGCQSCSCNEEYAYGVGCNPQTGQCECLPGVEGPKCDRCPYRWVLIHGQGCKECDSCVHDLLDSTDNLQSVVQPIMSEFESYAGSYFMNQKLSIINSSYYELKPQVAVIAAGGVDINPLELQVSALERQSKSQQIQSEAVTDRARETQRKAAKVHDESRQVEEEINESITMARNIVQDIISLAQGLKVGAGPQIDLALTEAQSLLDDIRSRDLGQPGRRVEDELQATIELLERVRQFSYLVTSRAEEAAGLRDRLSSLEARLEDLRNQSQTARQQALQTLQLVAGDRVSGLNRKVQDIGSISEAASSHLDDTASWLERARALLAAARSTLQSLRTQSERVLASQQALQIRIDEMNLSGRDVEQTTRRAQQHATDLMIQAQMLDSMLADTRSASEGAVRAANSYQDIVAAINAALTAARAAVNAAEGAGSLSDGVGERALQSRQLSEQLFARANSFMTKIVEQLQKQLDSAKIGVDVVKKMNEQTREQLLVIDESLEELERYQLQEAAAGAAEQAAASNQQANNALQRVSEISDQLPAQLEAANALARQMEGARKAVQLATEQVERVEGIIPNIQTLVKSVDDKFNVIEVLGKDVGDKIAELRRKVAVAREKANSIGVGVEFDGEMTLQLHNPEGLERSATANDISFHFRTQQPNGFLMYLGNEVGTKDLIQRTTSDDYMSAEVINGNLNVLVDLGSGAQRIINDAVYVSDGVWRKVIISRKGRLVKVRVVSEGDDRMERVEEVEAILPGSKSALNLNQAKSVLHIGGFPTSAKVQDNVRYTTFTGAIEDMRINGVPVGLWNFDSQTNVKDKGAMHRDKLVKLLPASGLRFNGAGYAAFSTRPYTFSRRFSIQMRFKTFTADGLLFLAGRGMADFLSVELADGAVVYQYSLGDGAVTLRSAGPYNDGEWHTVEASRQLREGVLKVDSVIVDQGSSPGSSRDLSVSEMMYFGGYPASVPYAEVTDRDFEGCLTDVYISGSNVNLGSNEESLGVFPGCPTRVVSDVSFEPQNPGYVAQPISNERFQQLTLKFKTTTPDGLLMYAANSDQAGSLSLSLNAGNLVLAILPGGQISTANFFRYNDDQWHVVTATMTNDHVRLEIDDYETFTLPIPAAWLSLTLGDVIYFGGLPSSLQLPPNSTGSADNLAGCLGDVTFNGEFVNFADSRERPNALMERCVLSGSVGADAADGATSSDGVATPTLLDISAEVEEPEISTEPTQLTDTPSTSDVEDETPPAEDVVRTTVSPSGGVSVEPTPTSGERCMLPIEPVPDRDVNQYSGHRFGNSLDSRWEFSSLPGKYYTESAFSIEIRTTAQEGVIFYAAAENQIDFLALYLKGGNVVYAFDCGSGPAVIASNKAYNDGEWHTIGFDRAEKEGKLYIDGDLVSTGVSVGSSQNVQVDFPVFLGGLPDALNDNERLQGNLEKIVVSLSGCIRNARLNGREFGAASNAVAVSPCSDKVEPGVFFSAGGGYLIAEPRFRVGLEVDITLDIKSRRLGGVLLSVYGKKDYLTLQMLADGSLSLTVENGRGEMVSNFTSPTKHTLCDGQWHSIRVVKVQNVATMSVDSFTVQPVFGVPGVSSTDTNSALFIGGAPERYTRGRAVGPHFVGCIRNLVVQGRPGASLKYAKTFGAVTANTCPLN